MEKNNKSLLYAGLAIIIVIIIALVVPHLKGSAPTVDTTSTPTTDTTVAAVPSTTGSAASNADWDAMLKQYSGKIVLFGADCSASPASQVQALGTKIALVNNSAVSHIVIFGADSGVTIPAYHYKTVLVATSDVINISCDAVQKAASITVK